MYVVRMLVEVRFIRECSRAYSARWSLGLDQVAWAGEPDPLNWGCSEGQAKITVMGGPSDDG